MSNSDRMSGDLRVVHFKVIGEMVRSDLLEMERKAVQRVGAMLLAEARHGDTANLAGRGWGPKYRVAETTVEGRTYKVLLMQEQTIATLPETPNDETLTAVAQSVGSRPYPFVAPSTFLHDVERVAQQMFEGHQQSSIDL